MCIQVARAYQFCQQQIRSERQEARGVERRGGEAETALEIEATRLAFRKPTIKYFRL